MQGKGAILAFSNCVKANTNNEISNYYKDQRSLRLDLRADGSYCVLPKGDQVTGKNIIRTAHGPLYFECNLSLESEEPYHLPTAIRSVILTTLHKAGLSTSPGLET